MHEGVASELVDEHVASVPRHDLPAAADFAWSAYASEPEFGSLYALPQDQLVRTAPIFRGLVAKASRVPDSTLGCYRAGTLVGVVTYLPDLKVSIRRALLRSPVAMSVALAHAAWVDLRHRSRLEGEARARWKAYGDLARSQAPPQPALQILVLAVARSARRSGVARRLLAAVEKDTRWPTECIVVQTWHATNVSVYERLGFVVSAHGCRQGVDCWTLVRPIRREAT